MRESERVRYQTSSSATRKNREPILSAVSAPLRVLSWLGGEPARVHPRPGQLGGDLAGQFDHPTGQRRQGALPVQEDPARSQSRLQRVDGDVVGVADGQRRQDRAGRGRPGPSTPPPGCRRCGTPPAARWSGPASARSTRPWSQIGGNATSGRSCSAERRTGDEVSIPGWPAARSRRTARAAPRHGRAGRRRTRGPDRPDSARRSPPRPVARHIPAVPAATGRAAGASGRW